MKTLSSPIDLIKKSFNVFFEKSNFLYFAKIYAWLLPFQLFFLYQNYFVTTQSKEMDVTSGFAIIAQYPWFLAAVIIVNLVFLFVSFWVELTALTALVKVDAGNLDDVKLTFKEALKKLWPFSLLSILVSLMVGGGLILLIIPGIIFSVWFGFAKYIFVDKKLGVMESIRTSRALVKERFWGVLGRLIVFGLFGILFQLVFALVPLSLGTLITPFFSALLLMPSFYLYREL